MKIDAMKRYLRAVGAAAVLTLAGAVLAGCVYYPDGYGYNTRYYGPAYAPAYSYVPPVVLGFGDGDRWGGGWGDGGGDGGWGGDDR